MENIHTPITVKKLVQLTAKKPSNNALKWNIFNDPVSDCLNITSKYTKSNNNTHASPIVKDSMKARIRPSKINSINEFKIILGMLVFLSIIQVDKQAIKPAAIIVHDHAQNVAALLIV